MTRFSLKFVIRRPPKRQATALTECQTLLMDSSVTGFPRYDPVCPKFAVGCTCLAVLGVACLIFADCVSEGGGGGLFIALCCMLAHSACGCACWMSVKRAGVGYMLLYACWISLSRAPVVCNLWILGSSPGCLGLSFRGCGGPVALLEVHEREIDGVCCWDPVEVQH